MLSSKLNTFHRISLSCKSISLFKFYFIVCPRTNQRLYPNIGVRPPCRLHRQPINFPGGVDGLKRAATYRSLVNRGYAETEIQDFATPYNLSSNSVLYVRVTSRTTFVVLDSVSAPAFTPALPTSGVDVFTHIVRNTRPCQVYGRP